MNIAILDDYTDTLRMLPCFARLAGHTVTVWTDDESRTDELAKRLAHTDALVLIRERTKITAELVTQLPRLRLISQRGGHPHIDLDACTAAGIVVSSNMRADAPSYATAELTWALLLAVARHIPAQAAALRAGRWQTGVGTTLRGKTLGLFGYGRIARVVAGYARAFGMPVVVWARPASLAAAIADGLTAAASQPDLFRRCDVVSLHLRLVDATRHIVTAADLASMKSTAVLINTSRADLIAPGALAAAVAAGRPGFAAVDVYEVEPMRDTTDPLLALDGVLATPHLGYVTREDLELQFTDVFDQIVAFAAGQPVHVVNPLV